MGDVLAIAESRDGQIRGVSREVVTTARTLADGLGGRVDALVLGGPGSDPGAQTLARSGADRVLTALHDALEAYGSDPYRQAVQQVVEQGSYAAIVLPATNQGKDLAPRVAAALDLPLASDVTGVSVEGGALTVVRPVYAGKAFAHLAFRGNGGVVTVRPNVTPILDRDASATVEAVAISLAPSPIRVVGSETAGPGSLDVSEATTVVSGGRGMKGPEHWPLLEELRDALGDGTALGASRAVVDAGWRPHAEQVGQTGKTVAPNLYVAVGISGAIQHLAGMRTAGTIVAVNKDPDAPIFQVADYGIVGDLFEVLPRLSEEVRRMKADA